MSLNELKACDRFTVLSVSTGRETGRRLADMGFTEGADGVVMRLGFLGGPMQVQVRGYQILLRREEAMQVLVERRAGEADFSCVDPDGIQASGIGVSGGAA